MKLEDSLSGGYLGLYGEVVTEDSYRISMLSFIPDVVIDCGANIGIFSRFARELFPNALIISVEPHPANIKVFKRHTTDKNIILLEKAIGDKKVWHDAGAANGSGEVYMSSGLGYPKKDIKVAMRATGIETITIEEIVDTYVKKGQKFIIKIDIEGNEHTIFTSKKSMNALKKADFIAAEIHWYALNAGLLKEVRRKTGKALKELANTHDCELDGVHFWATKKSL